MFVLLFLLLAAQLEDLTEIEEGHFSCPAESLALKGLGTIQSKVCGASSPARARGPGRSRLALPGEGGAATGLRPRRGARGRCEPGRAERRRGHLARGPGGGGAAPARRSSPPRPAPGRAAPGRTARTPAARGALGPCHGASPRAAATPGREATGAREARSGEAELSRRGPASAPKPSAPAARGPRVPSALGRRRSARCYSPHSLGPQRARTPTPTRRSGASVSRPPAAPVPLGGSEREAACGFVTAVDPPPE